jgi:soluble lytic murein transglycosylase-like protein
MKKSVIRYLPCLLVALMCAQANAGNQKEELLSASVRAALHRAVSDAAPPSIPIKDAAERENWLAEMSNRLAKKIPDPAYRKELLTAIHYEATRAGLDPQLVLGLIQVESDFGKYALSRAGARGYMQVMPFWVKSIGGKDDNLFHLRTNLRYGCTILRHYLDIEKGDLFRALGRYNGSLGRAAYPNKVHDAWKKNWSWELGQAVARREPAPAPAGVRQKSEPSVQVAAARRETAPPQAATIRKEAIPPQLTVQLAVAVSQAIAQQENALSPQTVALPGQAGAIPRAIRRDIVIVR